MKLFSTTYTLAATEIRLTFDRQTDARASCRALLSAGRIMLISRAIMAITTSSSTSVKASGRCLTRRRLRRADILWLVGCVAGLCFLDSLLAIIRQFLKRSPDKLGLRASEPLL